MDARTFAVDNTVRLLERLASQVSATIRTHGSDAVHDLRVAIRRFAQAVAVFKPCFPRKESRKIRRRLKTMMALAGEVRDCDIALEILADYGETSLEPDLRARRKNAERALLATLRQWVARQFLPQWRLVLEAATGELPVEGIAQRELHRLAKGFLREGKRAAISRANAGELHKVRIAAKKLRYGLELFLGLYGPAAEDAMRRIRGVQTLLGNINDCRAVRSLVSSLPGHAKVAAALRRKQRRKTQEFRRLWAAKFSGGTARQWIHSLQRPPRKPVAGSGGSAAPARKRA
jgi:CHAD domain-containing protein